MAQNDDLQDDAQVSDPAAPVNPLVDLEEATEKEQTLSEPEGLEDPGFVDEANWQAGEVERGVDRADSEDDNDLKNHGMQVEDPSTVITGIDDDLDTSKE